MINVENTPRSLDSEEDKREGIGASRSGRELSRVVRTQQLRFIGHLLRRNGLEKDALLGRIEGRQARGRP